MNENTQFYRFGIFTGHFDTEGSVRKEKSVGMAYMKEGNDMYSLKLWTFPREKYYLIPSKEDPAKILIMTREEKKVPTANRKFNWSIVGKGEFYGQKGVAQLEFDLIPQPIFMSITPAQNKTQPNTLNVA